LEWTEQIGDCDLGALTHEGTGDFLANDARGTRHHRQWYRKRSLADVAFSHR
jgi:hypothetical protein